MNIWKQITLGALGAGAALMLYWRFAARRHNMPCPPWLSWTLENSFVESVAGAETILDYLALKPGMEILDVGCGPGRLTLPAAQRVGTTGEVVALDIQPGMLERVQKKMETEQVNNVQLVQAGAGDGEIGCNRFDRALLVTVLGEIPDPKAAFNEIFRALKPGGILSVTEVLPDPHYQTQRTVRRLAAEAGFEEQSSFGNALAFTLNFVKTAGGYSPMYHLNVL